jgi:flagellar hook protein FlgE
MLTSLYTGISGMDANGTGLSVVGDNIANMNTTGFKSSRASFGDVLSQTLTGAGSSQVGRGVRVDSVSPLFTQGSFESTGNTLDLAVDGEGLFVVKDGSSQYYTRAGNFSVDKDGYVVNNDGYQVQGFLADATGTISGTAGDINLNNQQSQANATTKATIAANLNATDVAPTGAFTLGTDFKTPANYNESTTIKVYDSLGGAHDVSLYFVKTAANSWTVHYVYPDPASTTGALTDAGTQDLTFGTDGSLATDSAPTINFTFDGAAASAVDFGYGTPTGSGGTGFDGTTQFSSAFSVNQMSQDGYGAGAVTSVSISEEGIISASFTNGQSRTIAQVALARFMAPSSLTKLGRNLYSESYDSGAPIIAKPETSGTGRVLSNTLELSNVDLAQEFVKLISYQRAFQANSRMITTTDQMLQDLLSVIR